MVSLSYIGKSKNTPALFRYPKLIKKGKENPTMNFIALLESFFALSLSELRIPAI